MDLADLTLDELFARSSRAFEALVVEQAQTGDEAVGEALLLLEACSRRVSAECLFSVNEELEEVSTGSLKFLFLEYYTGKVHGQFVKLEGRGGHLRIARELFLEYLERCKNLRLLHEDETSAVDTLIGNDDDDDGEGSGSGSRGGGKTLSAGDQRARKIAKFKRDKEAKERMTALKQSLLHQSSAFADSDSASAPDREEVLREYLILQLQHFARDCLDEIPLLAQEAAMLAHMDQLRDQEQGRDGGAPGSSGEKARTREIDGLPSHPPPPAPLDPNRPGLSITRTSLAADGQVVLTRETVKATVFTPSLAPPTVTLEQFADAEVKAAEQRAAAQATAQAQGRSGAGAGAGAGGPVRRYDQLLLDGDEDDEEAVEAAARADRDWDDWREANPKGSGNKAGKRF